MTNQVVRYEATQGSLLQTCEYLATQTNNGVQSESLADGTTRALPGTDVAPTAILLNQVASLRF